MGFDGIMDNYPINPLNGFQWAINHHHGHIAIKKGMPPWKCQAPSWGRYGNCMLLVPMPRGAFFGRTFKLWDWPKTVLPMFVEIQKEWTDNSGTQKFLFSAPQKGSTPSPLLWRLWRLVIRWSGLELGYNILQPLNVAPCNRIWIVNPLPDL